MRVEIIASALVRSLAPLSDAARMLTDTTAIGPALIAGQLVGWLAAHGATARPESAADDHEGG